MRDDEVTAEETGYYEVALSNRQLVAAFCLFSVVIAGAFLLGVWFAREGEVLGTRPGVARVATSPPEPAAPSEGIDELKFFSEERRQGTTTGAVAQPPAVPTGPAAATGPPQPQRPAAEPPRPAPAPAPAGPAASAQAGALQVQVFSSPDAVQARRVLEQLRQAGFAPSLSPIEVGNRTMHRVRVGPFRERAEAERVAEQIKTRFRLSTWITAY